MLSYTKLRVGQPYTNETLDQAIKDLYASDLFADVSISGAESGDIVLRIRENPVVNRVLYEGNKTLKSDKITKEIKLGPRQIFTRTAVRAGRRADHRVVSASGPLRRGRLAQDGGARPEPRRCRLRDQ